MVIQTPNPMEFNPKQYEVLHKILIFLVKFIFKLSGPGAL